MRIKELLSGAEVSSYNGTEELVIAGVTGDSRKVKPGYVFLCIAGTNADGHSYIGKAAESGAVAAIVEYIPKDCPIPCIVCPDTRLAASFVFSNWFGRPQESMKMIGITGTNGKTSTTYMLRSIFEAAGKNVSVIGTIQITWAGKSVDMGMTTPDPERLFGTLAEMRDDGVEYVFMEVSSHSLCLGRVAPIHYTASAYTNLTPEHLDFHKTMEEYAAAKELLFTKSDLGVFCTDDDFVKAAAEKKLCKTYTASTKHDADYSAKDIAYESMDGVTYTLVTPDGRELRVTCPIAGRFTVNNTLGAIVLSLLLGIDETTVLSAIATMGGVPGRIERVTPPSLPFSVVIDYAHTPDALENVIDALLHSRKEGQKLTVLFGCGGDRDKTKRPVMGEIATRLADHTIITSDNSRSEDPDAIIQDILAGVHPEKSHIVIVDRRDAIAHAVANAEEGEIILIAGKGHENYEIKKDGKHPFSEKEEVAKAVQKRFGYDI
ncbi:MAG: UDP-N-acetylmuramoyl-L-alanyl-D-glutamate--2,6-diaminopimelate ligase [Clostridia bacterium]|nr:UDP-N-acetylmuramoyl-L-alanyl-D-glutamate--2,6-diaminopimelate ligase [Clostridia bacterium]